MNYLLCVSILFVFAAVSHKPHRKEWLTVAIMSVALWVNTNSFNSGDAILYWNRAIIVTVTGLLLLRYGSWLSFYHAIIMLAVLVTYAALAYDVSQGMHILIYNNYETTIYGLVTCQLIAIFPTLWAAYRDRDSSRSAWLVNLQRYKRS